MKLILASQSPRRKEILSNLGLTFEIITADVDESSDLGDPCLLVEQLSLRKGNAVRDRLLREGRDLGDALIISSDTVVSVDQRILGKPRDAADAFGMLKSLSGRSHQVISGICLLHGDRVAVSHEVTHVTFDALSDGEIRDYVRAAQPFDKAGAYAIQGLASTFICGIEGDYFNVVGLPVHEMCRLWREMFKENLLTGVAKTSSPMI